MLHCNGQRGVVVQQAAQIKAKAKVSDGLWPLWPLVFFFLSLKQTENAVFEKEQITFWCGNTTATAKCPSVWFYFFWCLP